MDSSPQSLHKGFTLIELVIIIVLLGILTFYAFPLVAPLAPVRLDGAASKLSSDIRYAQHLAVNQDILCGVSFSASPTNQYSIWQGAPGTLAPDPLRPPQNFVVNFNSGEYAGVTITSVDVAGGTEVQFDGQGIPYDQTGTELAAPGTITLAYSEATRTIQISPYTGRVTR